MRINFLLLILLAIFNVSLGDDGYTKLSVCGSAEAVPTNIQNDNPTCSTKPPAGMATASLGVAAFGLTGARCGQCFQLTGQYGKVTVMVTDRCDGGTACKQTDVFHFIIKDTVYNSIYNGSDSTKAIGNIFSLGSQIVSCGFLDNIKATFYPPDKGTVNYSTYLGVTLSNNNVVVKSMSLKGNGMVNYQAMTGQNGKFNWNKKDTLLSFPATLLITSNTGDKISYVLSSPPIADQPIDIGKQFNPAVDATLEDNVCSLATPPQYVYKDGDSNGWASYYSFGYASFDAASTDTQTGTGTCIKAVLNKDGAVSIFRDGTFSTKYLDKLSFDIKVGGPSTSLSVNFGTVAGAPLNSSLLTSTWSTVTLNVKDFNPKEIEDRISFFNSDPSQTMAISLDNIKWTYTADAPTEPTINILEVKNVPASTSTSGTTGVNPSTSTGTVSGDSSIPGIDDSTNEEGNSNGKNASSNSFILLPSIIFVVAFTVISSLLF